MDATALGGLPNRGRKLRDPADQPLLLRVDEQARIAGSAGVRLRKDAARAGMRVLEERRGVALEVQRLLPPEHDRFLRLHADDVVPDRADADRLRNLPLLRLRKVLPTFRDLRVRALNRFIDQVVEVDAASFAGRHPALREVHKGVENRLWLPLNAHELERRLQPQERELVVLPDQVDRDVAPAHLVQVIRDVARRVEGRPVAADEEILRGVPFEAECAQIDVARAVLLLGERHQPRNHPLNAPIEDRVALPEEGVEGHVHAAQRVQDARQDRLPDLADLLRELDVAPLEALGQPLDLLLQGLVGLELRARLLVQLHVAVLNRLVRIGRVHGQMGDGPVQQDHLAADVVHEVLARDRVARDPHQADQSVTDERIARPPHVQRSRRVRARVLEQHPLLPGW